MKNITDKLQNFKNSFKGMFKRFPITILIIIIITYIGYKFGK